MQDENLETIPQEQEIDISDIFAKRNGPLEPKETPKHSEEKQSVKNEDIREPKESEENSSKEADDLEESEKSPETDYQVELEKAERRYKDSQKWGSEMRKKLAAYERAIKKHNEEGALTTEEAEALLNYTQFEEAPPEDESLYVKYAKIWDDGVERMREFADDPKEIDKYVHAFQQLWRDSTPAEQEDILEEFNEFGDHKASLTRKMIKLGKDYYDETFGELYESGSIRNFKKKFAEKEKDFNKKIDKLQKELDKYKKKYEDYTEPTYKLPSGGSDNSIDTKNYTTDVKEIFSMR